MQLNFFLFIILYASFHPFKNKIMCQIVFHKLEQKKMMCNKKVTVEIMGFYGKLYYSRLLRKINL
jgi:hypothetical protein